MAFTLVQLETFRRVAAAKNFTRVAEQLNVSQPAVTQQVQALQREFGITLVDLVGRRTVLTDAGRFLAARAETLIGNVEALERDMREFTNARAGELRLGATLTIGSYALPDLIARFAQSHPLLRLHVEIANTDAMAAAVKAGQVALALVEGPLDDAELVVEPYAEDELVLVASPGHPLVSKRGSIVAKQLSGVPMIVREPGSGTRAQVLDALRAIDVEPHITLSLPSGEGIVRAVARGIGVAFLSHLVVSDAVASGRVVRVRLRDLTVSRTFRIVRPRLQTPSPAALAFMAIAQARDLRQ